MQRPLLALVVLTLAVSISVPAFAAGPSAKVSDLAWMAGSWKGTMGNGGTLEENWAQPDAGSMAALVRGTAGGATNMIELIVVEEMEGSLVLHIQQWNPGFEPRPAGPQEMRLVEVGDKKVVFEAVGDGGMRRLGYSSPAPGKFVISVTTAGGQFDIPLEANK